MRTRKQAPAAVKSGEVRAAGPAGSKAATPVPARPGFWEALRRALGAACC